MERIDPRLIADALLAAPGWARLGLTEPRDHLRQDAAAELARAVADRLGAAPAADAAAQQVLAL